MVSEQELEKLDFPLTEKDRRIILSSDEDFQPLSWKDLKTIIGPSTLCLSSPGSMVERDCRQ